MNLLRGRGHMVRRVYQVTSAGDNNGVEEVLFVTTDGVLKTARITAGPAGGPPSIVEVTDGW